MRPLRRNGRHGRRHDPRSDHHSMESDPVRRRIRGRGPGQVRALAGIPRTPCRWQALGMLAADRASHRLGWNQRLGYLGHADQRPRGPRHAAPGSPAADRRHR
ncbi:hypothetical protein OF001_U170057 [Pseudomonas sp. OF001]|nr:hypothetical protein OF001_U170057 [Pseudomonas sp. OF001]